MKADAHTPVVMIAFNRPDLLSRTMRNVSLAEGAGERDITMFIDGPRNKEDAIKQDEIERLVRSYQGILPRLKIVRREKNLGCRGNIVDAITTVINEAGRAIVIEDDILISRTFFRYMDAALIHYENDKRIWCINAFRNRYLKIPKSCLADVYLHPQNMCWGWGTWKDRWGAVDFDMKSWPAYREEPKNIEALKNVSYLLPSMLEAQYAGRLKTWDVQCSLHIVQNGLYAIEPRYALSKNIGHGSESEHCNADNAAISTARYYNFLPKFPEAITPMVEIIQQLPDVEVSRSKCIRAFRKLQRLVWSFGPSHDEPLEPIMRCRGLIF